MHNILYHIEAFCVQVRGRPTRVRRRGGGEIHTKDRDGETGREEGTQRDTERKIEWQNDP